MEPLPIDQGVVIPAEELGWRFSRASGPGGQGVNTTDSRVELVFDLARSRSLPEALRRRAMERLAPQLVAGVLVVVALEHRSQWRNRQAARLRLAALLRQAMAPPPPPRRPTRPSRGSVQRRLAAKRLRGAIKSARRGRPPAPED
jgi:ribosome-associated protein